MYEIKLDGYGVIAVKVGWPSPSSAEGDGEVQLRANQLDLRGFVFPAQFGLR
jgi:hypothetical protein